MLVKLSNKKFQRITILSEIIQWHKSINIIWLFKAISKNINNDNIKAKLKQNSEITQLPKKPNQRPKKPKVIELNKGKKIINKYISLFYFIFI